MNENIKEKEKEKNNIKLILRPEEYSGCKLANLFVCELRTAF